MECRRGLAMRILSVRLSQGKNNGGIGGGVEPTLGKRWLPLETHEKKLGVDF